MPHPESCVIIFDELGPERREIVQNTVKEYANGWWHHMPNVWIANGQSPRFWMDRLSSVNAGTNITLLVLSLPVDVDMRGWALVGPSSEHSANWFFSNYTGRPPSA